MAEKIWNYLFGSLFRRGATLLTLLTLTSYILGLARDVLFAKVFGASRFLDIYNASFILPDLLLNIFVAGALTAAFVPIFVQLKTNGQELESHKVATTVITAAPLSVLLLSLPLFLFMPQIVRLVAPGFSGEDVRLLIYMSRFMLLSPIIFAVSNTLGSILISRESFLGYGLSPVLYNLGIIAGVPLSAYFGPMGLVCGTLAGAVLHLCVRLAAVARSDFKFLWPPQFRDKNFIQILKLMVPRMAGQPIEQLIFSVFTSMASALFAGSIAMLSFARNFQSVPVSIFGISFATAVFASLSRKAAESDVSGFMYHFRESAKAVVLTTGVSALIFMLAGEYIIGFFLGGGKFNAEAVESTGRLLAFFALAIPAEGLIHLLVRSFYALKDTWTPIFISLPGLLLIVASAKLLVPVFSLNALPMSYALIYNLEAIALYFLLRRKLKKFSTSAD